jgi:hypothetical protein
MKWCRHRCLTPVVGLLSADTIVGAGPRRLRHPVRHTRTQAGTANGPTGRHARMCAQASRPRKQRQAGGEAGGEGGSRDQGGSEGGRERKEQRSREGASHVRGGAPPPPPHARGWPPDQACLTPQTAGFGGLGLFATKWIGSARGPARSCLRVVCSHRRVPHLHYAQRPPDPAHGPALRGGPADDRYAWLSSTPEETQSP